MSRKILNFRNQQVLKHTIALPLNNVSKIKSQQISFSQNYFLSRSSLQSLQSKCFFSTSSSKTQQSNPTHDFTSSSTYYQILGLETSASDDEIKSAYLQMVKKYHPDLSKEQNASQKFQLIQKAYQILSNPQSRSTYRSTLKITNPFTYEHADSIKTKFESFHRKQTKPDEWQFSYKLFKRHYQQVDQKQKSYKKYPGQGDDYWVHKDQQKARPLTYVQQVAMVAGSVAIATATMYAMWGSP